MILSLGSCTGGQRGEPGNESAPGDETTVQAEAFLFNSRIYRDGKPTSFRMEIYVTDTVIGLAGTGYFGKGAFRGRATADSVELYFPQSNEFLREATDDLVFSSSCAGVIPRLELRSLLTTLPTDRDLGPLALIESSALKDKRRDYLVRWSNCPWRFELAYDLHDSGWRLRQLRFDNGAAFQLRAERERYEPRTEVKVRKFRPRIPTGAIRMEP